MTAWCPPRGLRRNGRKKEVLEHLVASSISKHFTSQNILYDLQHGFREKRSCETQLIMLTDELSKNMQSRKQKDLILLDLLQKLHLYGIRADILK